MQFQFSGWFTTRRCLAIAIAGLALPHILVFVSDPAPGYHPSQNGGLWLQYLTVGILLLTPIFVFPLVNAMLRNTVPSLSVRILIGVPVGGFIGFVNYWVLVIGYMAYHDVSFG